jgi:hypothetical protein
MFFLSAPHSATPVFDANTVKDALGSRWPGLSWHERPAGGHYAYEWTVPTAPRELDGRIDRDGKTIVFDGELDDAVDAALILRRPVPEETDVFFYDELNTAVIPITPATEPSEVIAEFEAGY